MRWPQMFAVTAIASAILATTDDGWYGTAARINAAVCLVLMCLAKEDA